jgi:predicted nucleic acid-binding protein
MIYVDASVILAQLLGEGRRPPARLWQEPLVSSRLTVYEVWTRLNAHGLGAALGDAARLALGHLAMLELVQPVLARALEPFPLAVRTLDALHLASIEFLRGHGQPVMLAAYDRRLVDAARTLGIKRYRL